MDSSISYLSVCRGCGPKSFIVYFLSAASIVISVTFLLSGESSHGLRSNLSSRSPRVWPKLEVNWRSALATIIGFLGSAFGTVGGVGGGGIFVPMLNLIVGFDTKSAAALSKCMIMGASASSVWYNLRVSHPSKEVPIIDYDLALLFQPMLMLGITIGVALSVVFPYWLISVLIIILFLGTSSRSFFKGIQMWKEETIIKMETEMREMEEKARSERSDVIVDSVYEPLLPPAQEKSGIDILLLNLRWKRILALMLVWFSFLLLQILKNGTEVCSTLYWLFNMLQFPVALSVYAWEATRLWRESRSRRQRGDWEGVCEASIEWTALQLFLCALCAEIEHAKEQGETCGKSKAGSQRCKYLLAFVDEQGVPVRPATKDEAEAIARTLCKDISNSQLPCLKHKANSGGELHLVDQKPIGILSKHGGPCRHCGTTVSPQWRRGPPSKPILCNACGTRYRRTNQLSPLNPSANSLQNSAALARKKRQRLSNDEDELFQAGRKRMVGGCGRW